MILANNPAVLLLHYSIRSWFSSPNELFIMIGIFVFMEVVFSRLFSSWKLQTAHSWDWRIFFHHLVFALLVQYIVGSVVDVLMHYCEGQQWIEFLEFDGNWALLGFHATVLLLGLDFWFFVAHKTMHDVPWLYQHVHKVHHRAIAPTVLTSLVFSPLETILVSLGFIAILAMMGRIYGEAMIIVGLAVTIYNTVLHAGFEIFPRWWNSNVVTKQLLCVSFHDDHHLRFNYNYGLCTSFWDRLFGTIAPDFDKEYQERWSKKPKIDTPKDTQNNENTQKKTQTTQKKETKKTQ